MKEIFTDEHGEYCLIPLTQNQCAKVDPDDYERISRWKWFAHWSRGTKCFRAQRTSRETGKPVTILMHREITGAPKGMPVDHCKHDELDNRKHRLRVATYSQNNQNARLRKDNPTGAKGVYWIPELSKYEVHIQANGNPRILGYFSDFDLAVDVRRKATLQLHGEFAHFG